MPVQVPSSLFTLKKAECLLQELQLSGHSDSQSPVVRWAGGAGSRRLPRAGFQEGMLAKAGSAFLYSKLGLILDVGKCSKVYVIDAKGICGVRPMRVVRWRWSPGQRMSPGKMSPFFSSNEKWSPNLPFKLWENWISNDVVLLLKLGPGTLGKVWLHQEVELS